MHVCVCVCVCIYVCVCVCCVFYVCKSGVHVHRSSVGTYLRNARQMCTEL